jgi:spermidine synthase
MHNSLFIEEHEDGLAFYINGDLQFDTADESIYHEYLVVPAISLAQKRFANRGLRVLILGGGDGLAARDILSFSEVESIDLVDYDAEVVEMGKTIFQPYNQGSLDSDRLNIHIAEAFDYITSIPDGSYHVVICDFTYPTSAEETRIYSKEWFEQVKRVLHPDGLMSTNGVSPENRTTGFWCLYQTMLAAGIMTKPMQINIPSFRNVGYGNWGFFLGSSSAIQPAEINEIETLENWRSLTLESFHSAFTFPGKIASIRHQITVHTLEYPQLFYFLLNPEYEPIVDELEEINFLTLNELGTNLIGAEDLLNLESTVRAWLREINSSSDLEIAQPNLNKLFPVRHRYHSPKMTQEWLNYTQHLLAQVDFRRLVPKLLERSPELPPQLARDLERLKEQIQKAELMSNFPYETAELFLMLSLVLAIANVVTPDAVFAKGFSSRSGRSGGGSSSGSGSSCDEYNDVNCDDASGGFFGKFFGFGFTAVGGMWIFNIVKNIKKTLER